MKLGIYFFLGVSAYSEKSNISINQSLLEDHMANLFHCVLLQGIKTQFIPNVCYKLADRYSTFRYRKQICSDKQSNFNVYLKFIKYQILLGDIK